MIIEQIVTGKAEVFCYILGCEKSSKAVIIDPGGNEEEILSRLHELQLELVYIINTHSHPDHTCGNDKIKNATGAAVVMHKDDQALLQNKEAAASFKSMGLPLAKKVDVLVNDGDVLHFGECSLTVIHTPGHTPGGICLYTDKNLFTGDSLFVSAAGRVDLPGGDFNTLLASLEKGIASLPDDTIIWPGHNYGETVTSTIGREKKENPFLGGEW